MNNLLLNLIGLSSFATVTTTLINIDTTSSTQNEQMNNVKLESSKIASAHKSETVKFVNLKYPHIKSTKTAPESHSKVAPKYNYSLKPQERKASELGKAASKNIQPEIKDDKNTVTYRRDFNAPAIELSGFQESPYVQNSTIFQSTTVNEVLADETSPVLAENTENNAVDSSVELQLLTEEEATTTIALESINAEAEIAEAIIPEDFDFEIYQNQNLQLISKRSNGELYPFANFVIETEGGDIIAKKYTDQDAEFSGEISALNQQKLFVRFTSPGLSQDRIALN